MNTKEIQDSLVSLGLNSYEAKVYIALLKSDGMSHLQLARDTGINRSKIYRLIDELSKRSLVHVRTDDSGKKIHAADPEALNVSVVNEQEQLAHKTEALSSVLPVLKDVYEQNDVPLNFKINTYEGIRGFKQMLWNELKAQGEVLIIGSGSLESLVDNHKWAEKHRARAHELNYSVREIKGSNDTTKKGKFTDVEGYLDNSEIRYLDEAVVHFKHQIVVYNSTVSIYCYSDGQKVGLEMVNAANADFYRDMFERYWSISK